MALATTDPTTPDPTLSAQPAKKVSALPVATSPATPTLSGPAPTATTGGAPGGTTPATPAGPVIPSGPATTADPLAFAGAGSYTSTGDNGVPLGNINPTDTSMNLGSGQYGANPLGNGTAAIASGALHWDEMSGSYLDAAGRPYTGSAGSGGVNPAAGSDVPVSAAEQASRTAQQEALRQAQVGSASAASGYGAPGLSYSGTASALPLATTPAPAAPPGRQLTPGGANDVTPSGQLPLGPSPATLPLASSGGTTTPPPLPNAGPTSTTSNGTVGLTPTTPATALTNSTLSVSPTADRFTIANDQLHSQIANELEPQFQADARTIAAQSFGAGRGVSGMNRTREGNLELQHSRDINQLEANSTANALTGTIDDAYRNLSQADQQQAFQSGQQQTGFTQAAELQRLADSESAQSFAEALQQAGLGFSGSPADFLKWIAGQYARSGAGA